MTRFDSLNLEPQPSFSFSLLRVSLFTLHEGDMIASPDWATWSLESSSKSHTTEKQNTQIQDQVDASNNLSGGIALFTKKAHDDIHDTVVWHDFEGNAECDVKMAPDRSKETNLEHVEELLGPETGIENGSTQDREFFDTGLYRFDPLSPVESLALQRALKLSKYIPPSAQEMEDNKQHSRQLKFIDGKWRGTKLNEETGKRLYNLASRGTGLVAKENNEAREVFEVMCKNILPRRHPDWIMAQLTFHSCNMIGFDNIPSSRVLMQEEAKESVVNQSMEIHNLAHVTRLLAEASKVDTASYDIVDPTKAARARGRPATAVKNKMMYQSKAVFDALKELFPALFSPNTINNSTSHTAELK